MKYITLALLLSACGPEAPGCHFTYEFEQQLDALYIECGESESCAGLEEACIAHGCVEDEIVNCISASIADGHHER